VLVARELELAALDDLLDTGGIVVIEGGPGLGKTALVEECVARARRGGWRTLRAQGSELEVGFSFGVVRQLFERDLASMTEADRGRAFAGPAALAGDVLIGRDGVVDAHDASFALLHGLYWLTANLAGDRSLLVAVDDAHWADSVSMRWLGYLARRLEDLPVAVVVAMRPSEVAASDRFASAITSVASVLRPGLLDVAAAAAVVRNVLGSGVSDARCAALWRASGGNPFYLGELLRESRAMQHDAIERPGGLERPTDLVTRHVATRIRRLDPGAALLAGALAILGDGCELRHAAAVTGMDLDTASQLAAGLVDVEVLGASDPPRFLHPIVRAAVESSLSADERRRFHRAAATELAADRAAPGQVAAHLMRVSPAADAWVLGCLRTAARLAMASGAPVEASELLRRALAEPPAPQERVEVLRELAAADVTAGRASAVDWVEEALSLTADQRARAAIAHEVAQTYAALFRWVEAVDVTDRALVEIGDRDAALSALLEAELVVDGMHDARRAHRVAPMMARLLARGPSATTAEALSVARGMVSVLTSDPNVEAVSALEAALVRRDAPTPNWDTRAALLWTLIILERFNAVEAALPAMIDVARRGGSARGLIAVYSSLGLLRYRLGALPEAEVAARLALRVLQEGDFTAGLGVGAIVADVATESGDLDAAQAVLDETPAGPPGVISVLVPAAYGRLNLARGDGEPALRNFEACLAMFSPEVWGMKIRDVAYLHARSASAEARLLLGDRGAARELADAELADARELCLPRALGVALRTAGLAHGGRTGLDLLEESVGTLRDSPALLERAKSMTELGAAMRRAGHRIAARPLLAEGLDLAAGCRARPIAEHARAELRAAGGRPRRDRRRGVEALTPSELRVARMAADGQTNRQIAHGLYLTTKTVETHLAHAYAKLGISNRGELPNALA
jgi:DNA-binding CsgD family transcriptional regulator